MKSGLQLINAIARRSTDAKGLTSADCKKLVVEFGKRINPAVVAKIVDIFKDLVVTGNERCKLSSLLKLDKTSQGKLNKIIGSDGRALLSKQSSALKNNSVIDWWNAIPSSFALLSRSFSQSLLLPAHKCPSMKKVKRFVGGVMLRMDFDK